jgi:hypothetical protein
MRKKHGRLKPKPEMGKRESKRRERRPVDLFDVIERKDR